MRGGVGSGGSDEPGGFVRSAGASGGDAAGKTQRLEVSAAASAPAGERLTARTLPARQAARRFSWRTIGATAGVVFLLALGFITAIELISGNPLSDIFGDAGTGTSLNNVFSPSSPPPTTVSTTTSTSAPASTSSTTNNWGVDKNYQLGLIQTWNASITRDLTPVWNALVSYTGIKGTDLDLLNAPNRNSSGGLLIATVQPFTWESSGGH